MRLIKTLISKKEMEVEVVRENSKTFLVRLPDGNIIKRHKKKHVRGEE